MEIRKLKENELEKVQEIAKKVIRKNYKAFFAQDAIDWFINSGESDKEFIKNFQNCNVLIDNDEIKGFNIFFDNFIHLMMVDTDVQRAGYGTKLLNFAEQKMKENDFTKMKLETFKENEQGVNFYKKNEWNIESEKQEDGLNVTRVFLEKRIK